MVKGWGGFVEVPGSSPSGDNKFTYKKKKKKISAIA